MEASTKGGIEPDIGRFSQAIAQSFKLIKYGGDVPLELAKVIHHMNKSLASIFLDSNA